MRQRKDAVRRVSSHLITGFLGLLAGCVLRPERSWEHTRQDLIEPMNTAFHRALPRSIRQRDLDAILAFYDVERGTGVSWDLRNAELLDGNFDEEVLRWRHAAAAESIRSRYERILDLFQTVDSAEVRIESVDWGHADGGYPAQIHLIVRGAAGDTTRQLDQRATVRFAFR